MPAIFDFLGKLGAASAFFGFAWLFWKCDKPGYAKICFYIGLVTGGMVATAEAWHAWNVYSVQLSIKPSTDMRWGGLYENGESVQQVAASLLRNGEVTGPQITVSALDIPNRELSVALEPADQGKIPVLKNGHQQGYIRSGGLDAFCEKNFTGANKPYAIATSQPVHNPGERVGVDANSAIKEIFEKLTLQVRSWHYPSEGVNIAVFNDEEPIVNGIVTRDEALPIPELKLIVGLLALDLREAEDRRAQFVFLKFR